jgi:sulfatase maturation enzyme AslB (radical SAM superfamily)
MMEQCIHDLMDKFENRTSFKFYGGEVTVDGVTINRSINDNIIGSRQIQNQVSFFLSNGSTINLTTTDENFK